MRGFFLIANRSPQSSDRAWRASDEEAEDPPLPGEKQVRTMHPSLMMLLQPDKPLREPSQQRLSMLRFRLADSHALPVHFRNALL